MVVSALVPDAAPGTAIVSALNPPDATPAAPSGGGSALLTFEILPPGAAAAATVTVNGLSLAGSSLQVQAKQPVTIVVRAAGYQPWERRVFVTSDLAVKVQLTKRAVRHGRGGRSPVGPGGGIDL